MLDVIPPVPQLLSLQSPQAAQAFSQVTTIYTDLDGTLLAPGGKLLTDFWGNPSADVAQAIVDLRRCGVELVVVTGRSRVQGNEFIRILDALAFIGEMGTVKQERGTSNINVTYDTGSFAYDQQRYRTPYDAIAASGAAEVLMERYPGKLEYNYPRCLNRDVTHALRGDVDVDEVNEFLASRGYQLAFEDNGMLFSGLSDTTLTCQQIHGYHIVPAGTSKAISVAKDMQQRGLSPQQAVAIGDGFGDIEMGWRTGSFVMMVNGLRQERNRREAARLAEQTGTAFVTQDRCCDGWVEFARAVVAAKQGRAN